MAPETQAAAATKVGALPVQVTSPVDIGRLIRELESIDNSMLQLGLRRTAGSTVNLPRTSQLLDQTAQLNQLNLLQTEDRHQLRLLLQSIRGQAPVLHVSFSADPSALFIEKLMTWLRREIHPLVLLTIGLQPNIGAGCIVRTTNKHFDFSLRQDFARKRDLLNAALRLPTEADSE